MNAILMGNGKSIAYENLGIFPVPESTPSWTPIPWKFLVDTVLSRVESAGWTVNDVNLLTSGKDKETGLPQELFGTIGLDNCDGEIAPQLALRTSYNMHYKAAVCAGARVLVCSNGIFSGEFEVAFRKQTTFALRDITGRIDVGVSRVQEAYDATRKRRDFLRTVPLSVDDGFGLIGVAVGNEVITPTMANVAYRDWRDPRHEEFSKRDAWSLYNCFTQGVKKTRAGNLLTAHTDVDEFFVNEVSLAVLDYDQVPF